MNDHKYGTIGIINKIADSIKDLRELRLLLTDNAAMQKIDLAIIDLLSKMRDTCAL